jgi:hypothetical protein
MRTYYLIIDVLATQVYTFNQPAVRSFFDLAPIPTAPPAHTPLAHNSTFPIGNGAFPTPPVPPPQQKE